MKRFFFDHSSLNYLTLYKFYFIHVWLALTAHKILKTICISCNQFKLIQWNPQYDKVHYVRLFSIHFNVTGPKNNGSIFIFLCFCVW